MKVTKRTSRKVEACKKVYLIVCYAQWCVREFPWTGKWEDFADMPVPIVWDYDDHNGAFEEYAKRNIYYTTTGVIHDWTFNKNAAERVVKAFNRRLEETNSVKI